MLTRRHSRTFYLASALLPPAKCRAVRALYAFCRISDDLVDGEAPSTDLFQTSSPSPRSRYSSLDRNSGPGLGNHENRCSARERLERWRRQALREPPRLTPCCGKSLVALAWADVRARYRIPVRYAEQLIEGVAQDLRTVRYDTFEELAAYCYGVASTVGLMSMHIIGFAGPEAIPYAVKLGVALQLTNILRDVGEDWRMGRLYLPRSELRAFDLSEEDIAIGCIDERWQRFLRFQIERTRRLYAEALPGIALLHRNGRFAIAAAAELYRAILDDIEAHKGDVFGRRAFVSTTTKLQCLPFIWWRSTFSLPPGRSGRTS
ncbi:MAG: phytoene/squalene synthase family protein [Chloroflexi bacterium]|nr:phytoene/squalene synthase family protein [Chloroflexota bacterium]